MNSHTTSLFPCESNPIMKLEQAEASCPYKVFTSMADNRKLHQDCVVCQKLKLLGVLLEITNDKGEKSITKNLLHRIFSNLRG